MRASLTIAATALAAALVFACSEPPPYKTPSSDNNFDDPDDPGSSGGGDPYGKKDAAGDAAGRFCVADRDCPAAFRCSYSVAGGCSASGTCQAYDATKCVETTACGCNDTTLIYCLAAGWAPSAVKSLAACAGGNPIDSGSTEDASTSDASAD